MYALHEQMTAEVKENMEARIIAQLAECFSSMYKALALEVEA